MEVVGRLEQKRQRGRQETLYDFRAKIPDPYDDRYWTQVRIWVPWPKNTDHPPCVMVGFSNAKSRFFIRVANEVVLLAMFGGLIDHSDLPKIESAVSTATMIKNDLDLRQRQLDELSHEWLDLHQRVQESVRARGELQKVTGSSDELPALVQEAIKRGFELESVEPTSVGRSS